MQTNVEALLQAASTSLMPHCFAVRLPTAPCCAAARARAHGCCQHVERAWSFSPARHGCGYSPATSSSPESASYSRAALLHCSQDQHDGVQTNAEARSCAPARLLPHRCYRTASSPLLPRPPLPRHVCFRTLLLPHCPTPGAGRRAPLARPVLARRCHACRGHARQCHARRCHARRAGHTPAMATHARCSRDSWSSRHHQSRIHSCRMTQNNAIARRVRCVVNRAVIVTTV